MDPINYTAGAGTAGRDATTFIRLTDNALSLQAETFVIMGLLTLASLREGHVVIHTDSRSVIECLQYSMHMITTNS